MEISNNNLDSSVTFIILVYLKHTETQILIDNFKHLETNKVLWET